MNHTIELSEIKVRYLGDPHLGKVFKHGVPLDRRGEREAEQAAQFQAELDAVSGIDYHICMGDLFDKFLVPPEIVLLAALLYINAASAHPAVNYIVLRGNHDASRDLDRKSSFDLFKQLVSHAPNIHVVAESSRAFGPILCCPWHPFKNADHILAETGDKKFEAVFGHWDIQSFGGNDDNLMPEAIWSRTDLVVTGHVHQAEDTLFPGGKRRIVTGSMQPYSHAEDADGERYVTLTVAEYEAAPNKSVFKDMAVRLLVEPGEEVPEIDCRQLSTKPVAMDDVEAKVADIDDFNFRKVFDEVMQEGGVDPEKAAEVWIMYEGERE